MASASYSFEGIADENKNIINEKGLVKQEYDSESKSPHGPHSSTSTPVDESGCHVFLAT